MGPGVSDKLQTFHDLTPARKNALREMAKVNLAAAIVLGGEAGFDKHVVLASQFSVLLAALHTEYRMTPAAICAVVNDALKPDAK